MKKIKSDNLEIRLQPLSTNESQRMWAEIYQRLTAPVPKPSSFWHIFVAKPAYLASIVAVLALVASTGTVALAQQAEPGDALYPVERAYETLQLAVAVTPERKAQLSVKFSKKRIKEVAKILEKNFNQAPLAATIRLNENLATSTLKLDDSARVEVTQAQSTTITMASTSDTLSNRGNKPATKQPSASIKNLEKNHQTIVGALRYLENTKQELKKFGDDQQAATIDSLVGQLSQQTENYIDNLEKIKKSSPHDKNVNDRINRSEQELRVRFKLDSKRNLDDRQKTNGELQKPDTSRQRN